MRLNSRTATAKDFDNAAQQHANASWFWLILAGIIFYYLDWWAVIPTALCLLTVSQSISATKQAGNLRDGTYKIPNPNNGAPDGDANNVN